MAVLARQERATQPQPPDGCRHTPPTEKSVHEAILAECGRRGWYVLHARMDMRSTIAVGAPDFVILAGDGRTICVEVKRPGGKLRLEQAAARHQILGLGHEHWVVHSMAEFLEAVR